jgi:hypothetical protein
MNANCIEFENGSKIISKTDKVSLRGTFADLIFLEDVDRYDDLKNVWFAAVPQLGEKGKIITSSNLSFHEENEKNSLFIKAIIRRIGGFQFHIPGF